MTVWPSGSRVIPPVTDEYGWRAAHPITGVRAFHYGIDLVGWLNNKSPCDGRIIFAGYNGGAGNEVRVQAANGDTFRIKHNAFFAAGIYVGAYVSEGQDVGRMGTTGDSTGVHCHFECWIAHNTSTVNPRDYMAAAIGNNTQPAGPSGTPIDGDDMPSEAWLNGLGTEIINRVLAGVWERPITYTRPDGTTVTGTAREWLVNTSNMVGGLAEKLEVAGFTPEQIQTVSDAIAAQVSENIAIPTEVEIAKAVRAEIIR